MSIKESDRYYLKMKLLYYLYRKNYTQVEAAKLLNISRVTVRRLLAEAEAEGMVKIEITDVRNTLQRVQLEDELREKYGLSDVVIADSSGCEEQDIIRLIASEAASYCNKLIKSGMKIGVTWGRTLSAMVSQLDTNRTVSDLVVYTLVGNTADSPDFQPNILAQKLLQKYSGALKTIAAPFICGTSQLCADIKKEPQVASILSTAKDLDLTLVGIGEAPVPGSEKLSDYPFDHDIIEELVRSGAVGDICGNFIDIDGNVCATSIKDRVVSIDIEELPHHKMVVGIGGGANKVRSITGALHGGYLDVLITDSETAYRVLHG